MKSCTTYGEFPPAPAVLSGLGLGAFFDGICSDQGSQWHLMGTWSASDSLENGCLKVAV